MGTFFKFIFISLCFALGGCSGGKPLTPQSETITIDDPKDTSFGNNPQTPASGSAKGFTADLKSNSQDGALSIASGSPLTLSWFSEGSTSCEMFENANTPYTIDRSGNRTISSLVLSTTYTLRCQDSTGAFKTDSVRVDVTSPNAGGNSASVGLYANGAKQLSVSSGSSATLMWISNNTTNCELRRIGSNQILSYSLNESVGLNTGLLTSNTTFVISCINQLSSVTDFVDIMIGPATSGQPPTQTTNTVQVPLVNLKANNSDGPVSVNYQSTAILAWTSNAVLNCDIKLNGTSLKVAPQELTGIATPPILNQVTATATCPTAANPLVTVTDSVTISIVEPADQLIFVSSTTFNGNLGGLAGADQKCTQLAIAANQRPERPWKAVLSDTATAANSRILSRGPTKRIDGLIVFDSEIFGIAPKVPVSINQNGLAVNTGTQVWTNTNLGGGIRATGDSSSCNNWTDDNDKDGRVGNIAASTTWLDADGDSDPCDDQKYIYCISQ